MEKRRVRNEKCLPKLRINIVLLMTERRKCDALMVAFIESEAKAENTA
jgi:hypothetical protein